ncbi:hypothetical protein J4U01_gp072 [Mycobacterium phage Kumao]|uniref:dATP/dGTP diphosphohydrolase N-terminal domain-containing protein n=1 Tax=Mycobacterium phage Kumao TaxID=2041344 RepID=A0A2D1GPZ1_9CAUD|nr:hypothetical protein J4U01_gp072 [Mycobacterium phage Kumao]ATN94035.1 hypothetical protein SEA_KUMAO_72 [Mycobacterium phage Kumao]
MSDEVRVVSSTGGRKGTKLERPDLIPPSALVELARHFGIGADKYTERDEDGNVVHNGAYNWLRGYDWSLSFAALQRHALAFWAGEDYDLCKCQEPAESLPCKTCGATGSKHIIAAMWHCAVLSVFMDQYQQFDDRPVRFLERLGVDREPAENVGDESPLGYSRGDQVERLTTRECLYRWKDLCGDPILEYQWIDGKWRYRRLGSDNPWFASVTEDDGVTVPAGEGPFERL